MKFLTAAAIALTLSPAFAQSGDPAIDRFFQSFSEEWLRIDPQTATRLKFFPAGEQSRLDAMLTDSSPAQVHRQLELIRKAHPQLRQFDRARLSASRRAAAGILDWTFTEVLRAERFLGHDYVFSQFFGASNRLIEFFLQNHSIRSREDARAYLARLRQVARVTDQWIAEAKAAEAKGILPPKFILEQTSRQISGFIDPQPGDNLLVKSLRDRLKPEDRAEFDGPAQAVIAGSVYPAWRKLASFLDGQAQRASSDAGFWKLPRGLEAYASVLRWNTTTNLTADEIHRLGLSEVARIEKEMDIVLGRIGLTEGTVAERYRLLGQRPEVAYPDTPDVRDRILADYGEYIRLSEARMQSVFRLPESHPVEVRRVPAYREAAAAASYSAPPADGSLPGIFYVPLRGPTFNRLGMRTLAHHEAIPGHHFQMLYRKQRRDAPAFQRGFGFGSVAFRSLGGFAAYGEGWGLYAETLADEMGLYQGDDIGKLGYLQSELFRAARLVVDTGIHARRWTREQAVAYMKAREPRPGMAAAEVDRYIVMPGQACAYKVGHLKILELREKAKRALGPKFDLKDFHAVVLGSGAVPLSVLEELVNDYIHGDGSVIETWELNVPKSKPSGPARSAVLTLTVQGDQETSETHIVRMDGVETHAKASFIRDGKMHPYAGTACDCDFYIVHVVSKLESVIEFEKTGKVMRTAHTSYSEDGKTRTVTIKGEDQQGKPYEHLLVFDRK